MLACLLVAALAGASGASGAARSTPAAWFSVYCGATLSWNDTVEAETSKLVREVKLLKDSDLDEVRTAFLSYLGQVATATEIVSSRLKAAGSPSLPNGAKIEQIVSAAFEKMSAEFAAADAKAQRFSENPGVFTSQSAALGDALHAEETSLGLAIEGLRAYATPAFKDAGSKVASCRRGG